MSKSSNVADIIKEGVVHFREGNYDLALVCWEVAQELEPDNLHIKKYLQLLEGALEESQQSSVSSPVSTSQESQRADIPERKISETPTFPEVPAVHTPSGVSTRNSSSAHVANRLPTPLPPMTPRPSSSPATPRPNVSPHRLPSRPPRMAGQMRELTDSYQVPKELSGQNSVTDLWAVTSELELPMELGTDASSSEPVSAETSSPSHEVPHVAHDAEPESAQDLTPSEFSEPTSSRVDLDVEKAQEQVVQSEPTERSSGSYIASETSGTHLPDTSDFSNPSLQRLPGAHDSGELRVPHSRSALSVSSEHQEEVEVSTGPAPARTSTSATDISFVETESSTYAFAMPRREEPVSFHDENSGTGLNSRIQSTSVSTSNAPKRSHSSSSSPSQKALGVKGESLARALDAALAKEFTELLGSDVDWPSQSSRSVEASQVPENSLPLIESVRFTLVGLLGVGDESEFRSKLDPLLDRSLDDLLDLWPLPEDIVDAIGRFFDRFYRYAMELYVKRKYARSYHLFLLCFCARPDDSRVQTNLEKLKKRLQ